MAEKLASFKLAPSPKRPLLNAFKTFCQSVCDISGKPLFSKEKGSVAFLVDARNFPEQKLCPAVRISIEHYSWLNEAEQGYFSRMTGDVCFYIYWQQPEAADEMELLAREDFIDTILFRMQFPSEADPVQSGLILPLGCYIERADPGAPERQQARVTHGVLEASPTSDGYYCTKIEVPVVIYQN